MMCMHGPDRNLTVLALLLPVIMATLAGVSCDVMATMSGALENGDVAAGGPFVGFLEPVDGRVDLGLVAGAGRTALLVLTADGSGAIGAASATARAVPDATRSRGAPATGQATIRGFSRTALAAYEPGPAPRLSTTGLLLDDYPGKADSFYMVATSAGTMATVAATCRYASGSSGPADAMEPVDFGSRQRTLSVWVADDSWSAGGAQSGGTITQTMVDAVAGKFFGAPDAGGDPVESIYAWGTGLLGDEWGTHDTPAMIGGRQYNLIPESGNITILLADISGDDSDNGGIVGYFYPGDTIVDSTFSNGRVMFVIDAPMYANPSDTGRDADTTWAVSDYWPQTVYSTLAHEFQHMIHWYQKAVVRGGNYLAEETWVDELCSMQVEDLLSDRLGVPGPRGVDPADGSAGAAGNQDGRMVDYNVWPEISPGDWATVSDDDVLYWYGWAYSFGAYLTRNYGGAAFVRSVVQSAHVDGVAITAAANAFSGRNDTLRDLLRRWGAAVLLSGRTDAPEGYRLNTGTSFLSTLDGVEYRLGSINAYNYIVENGIDSDGDDSGDTDLVGPWLYDPGDLLSEAYNPPFGGDSNAFVLLGTMPGAASWRLEVPEGLVATVIID